MSDIDTVELPQDSSIPFPYYKVVLVGLVFEANSLSIWTINVFMVYLIQYYYPLININSIGYKYGIMGSAYSVGNLFGNLFWGLLSDRLGRRPVMLYGLLGTTISSLCFGFAPNFWFAVFFRFMWGLLNGNVGVCKTYMGEILDDSNTAKGMSLFGVIGGIGRTVGAILGGFLAMPADNYPSVFKNTIFDTYPFSLPCIVIAINCILIFIMSYFHLTETLVPSSKKFSSQDLVDSKKFVSNEDSSKNKAVSGNTSTLVSRVNINLSSNKTPKAEKSVKFTDGSHDRGGGDLDENIPLLSQPESSNNTTKRMSHLSIVTDQLGSNSEDDNFISNAVFTPNSMPLTPNTKKSFILLIQRLFSRKSVIVSSSLYFLSAILQLSFNEIFPLFSVTSVNNGGGFGFSNQTIGSIYMIAG